MAKSDSTLPMVSSALKTIKQPNKVTNASYDYSLVQQKVFSFVMLYLQNHIDEQLKFHKGVSQLSLFKDDSKIEIPLLLKDFTNHHQSYEQVISSIENMADLPLYFPVKSQQGVAYERRTHLLADIFIPKEKKYKKEIIVTISKDVAREIINIASGYTRFAYEISFNAKCKYTPRIYQLICRWRDREGFKMKYKELRDMLRIPDDKYKEWKDFKKRIIKDVQAELNHRADVWFEVELYKEDGEQMLSFKVITSEKNAMLDKKRESIIEMLKYHFGYSDNDFKPVSGILLKPHLYSELYEKLIELKAYVSSHREINNVPAYVNIALAKEFKGRK